MLWLVALQGISCGDMPGILWLLPFQPPQTSQLTAQSDAPSLCLLWEAPRVLTRSEATPGGHRSPGLSPSPFPCVWTWKICDVLPESHCLEEQSSFWHHLGHFSAIRTCVSKISSLGGETGLVPLLCCPRLGPWQTPDP